MSYTSPELNRLLPEADADDEELAEGEDQEGDLVAEVDGEVFAWARRLDCIAHMLDGAESNGIQGALEALQDHGLPVKTIDRGGGLVEITFYARPQQRLGRRRRGVCKAKTAGFREGEV
jgi:hypothetical protein